MVSPLWKACAEGRFDEVNELLGGATSVDLEVKDHIGETPLIVAVKNGYVQIVSLLLAKGADPNNGSSLGPASQYTSDPAMTEVLSGAHGRVAAMYDHGYDAGGDESMRGAYFNATYPYYPTLHPAQPAPDAAVYYPPPPPQPSVDGLPGGPGHLPPADIARFIPCRYFPACRYGASCMFLHPPPQSTYYPPQVPYPQFDPSMVQQQPYQPTYYPPSFPQPNNGPVNPLASPPPAQFTPNGHPVALPYGPMSPMMSPTAYAHSGQLPVPMSIPPLPPLQHPSHSPQANYPPLPPAPSAFTGPPSAAYYPSQPPIPVTYQDANGPTQSPVLNPQSDAYAPNGIRENGHQRRASARRPSFVNRTKPACMFFPAGRCRNGDDCRFPHVQTEGAPIGPGSYFAGSRGAGPRSRANHGTNGYAAIDQKLAAMSLRDDQAPQYQNGDASGRSPLTDRPKFANGYKNGINANGAPNKRTAQMMKQRVPNADEFPVLAGATTPPIRSTSNGSLSAINGGAPTAAQVLQAPPPFRTDNKEGSVNTASTDSARPPKDETSSEPVSMSAVKLPISFAAVATASVAPEAIKEVQVSA